MEKKLTTVEGVEIRIETFTKADEFRSNYGRPRSSNPDAVAVWEATKLPAGGYLRRRAAEYLHEVQSGECGICSLPIELQAPDGHPGHIEIDHILAKVMGGLDVWSNVRAAHNSCNSERGNGYPELSPATARAVLGRKIRELRGLHGLD